MRDLTWLDHAVFSIDMQVIDLASVYPHRSWYKTLGHMAVEEVNQAVLMIEDQCRIGS